jgi:hypothetical protein
MVAVAPGTPAGATKPKCRRAVLRPFVQVVGALGALLIGIPIVSDPRHTTGAAKPFLGVALRFKASKGDDAAAWKARL